MAPPWRGFAPSDAPADRHVRRAKVSVAAAAAWGHAEARLARA
jgi:hypothetical protein